MQEKKRKKFNWTALFHSLWSVPLAVGIITLILKLFGVFPFSWLVAASPVIFAYSSFAIAIIYVTFFQEKIEKIFHK